MGLNDRQERMGGRCSVLAPAGVFVGLPQTSGADRLVVFRNGCVTNMERSTELMEVYRSVRGELIYRLNWIIFGTIGAVLMAMIPVIGWLMAVGLVGMVLWKTFGFRETQLIGSCPACTKSLPIDPKTDVLACPVCQSCIAVQDDRLVIVKID